MKLTLILVLVFATRRMEAQEMKKDMVQFDQAFIPVWFYTYEGEILKAKASIFLLEFTWQQFRMKYADAVKAEEWRSTFDRIDGWLGDAYYAIDANRPEIAFNQLEYVKYELRQLRRLYGISYYLDELYDFQDAATVLIKAANDPVLFLMDWYEFEDLADAVHLQWRGVMSRFFDAELHGFDEQKLALYLARQKSLERALNHFVEMVECADREAILAASWEVEAAFNEILRLFGRFETLPTFFAINPQLKTF